MQATIKRLQRLANRAEVCITTSHVIHRACSDITRVEHHLWVLVSDLFPNSRWVAIRRVTTGIDVEAWGDILNS